MPQVLTDPDRQVLRLSGADVRGFLQGLVSNDLGRLAPGHPLYAALLSPQGKYLADFLLVDAGADGVLVDAAAAQVEGLARRLGFYRLRKDVTIAPAGLSVTLIWGDGAAAPPATLSVADPRHPGLGLRAYGAVLPDTARAADYAALRVALGVPEAGLDLIAEESFILEAGFERLHGVDFRKGCYVGQEVTARMKHKADLRRGLCRVRLGGAVHPGTVVLAGEREAGRIGSVAGDRALALLRLDRLDGPLTAAGVEVTPEA